MLADRLTTSEREQLLNEKPMVNFQSQQWDKAPKAHIQDHVPPHTILNKIMVMPERKTAFREKQEILSYRIFHRCHCCHLHYRLLDCQQYFIIRH